jgi:hypothetical protein
MAHYHMSDDAYWEPPAKYRPVTENAPIKLAFFVMGDPEREDVPVAAVLDMQPGDVIGYHAHDCERVEVVVKGTLDVGEGKVLHAGDVMVARPLQFYGPHVAGPDGCVTVEIFAKASEAHSVIYQLPDGSTRKIDALESIGRPDDVVNNDAGLAERVAAALAAVASQPGE